MNIGKNTLNENESTWLVKYTEDLITKTAQEIQTALNKPISREDVIECMKKYTKPKEDKPEEVVSEEEDEYDDDDE